MIRPSPFQLAVASSVVFLTEYGDTLSVGTFVSVIAVGLFLLLPEILSISRQHRLLANIGSLIGVVVATILVTTKDDLQENTTTIVTISLLWISCVVAFMQTLNPQRISVD